MLCKNVFYLDISLNYDSVGLCQFSIMLRAFFLVKLRSTYKVHFCHHNDRDHDEINPIGMYDSSNESSQRTE